MAHHHDHLNTRNAAERESAAVRVTLIGALLDLLLGIAKIIAGLTANSMALVSDGIHSLSDLISDAFVVVIARVSHRAPDRNHPYGHGRFETVGTVVISVFLFAVAGGIAWDSVRRLQNPSELVTPGTAAFVVTILSILGKEWIYRYTLHVARQINSSMLVANAWHSRSDALSSIVVLIGLGAAWMGYLWADLVAALLVALLIGRIAWQLLWESLSEVLDTALPDKELAAIRQHILESENIQGVHDLRGRRHGAQILLDIHLQVDSRISVSEGHYFSERINHSLKEAFPAISDVVVHIDPEFDKGDLSHNRESPTRHEVEEQLFSRWQDLLDRSQVSCLQLHYLYGKVEAEVMLNSVQPANRLAELRSRCEDLPWLAKLTFYAHCE